MPVRFRPLACALLLAALCGPRAAAAFPGVRPGLEFGVLGASCSHPEGLTDFDGKVTAGFAAAGMLRLGLPGRIGLETGLRYSRDADRIEDDLSISGSFVGSGHMRITTTFQRLGVPVRLSAALPFGHGFSVEAGAEPQYLLRADQTVHSELLAYTRASAGPARPAAIIFESMGQEGDVTADQPRWNALVSLGLGWEFPAAKPAVVLHARWLQGVSDQTLSPYLKRYPRAAEFAMGVRW